MPTDRELRYSILLETRGAAEASEAVRAVANAAETALTDIGRSAEREFSAFGRAAQRAASLAETSLTGALETVETALAQTARTGRVEWRAMVESMANDLASSLIQTQVTEPLSNSLNDLFDNAAGAFLSGRRGGGGGGFLEGLLEGLFASGAVFEHGRAIAPANPLPKSPTARFASGGVVERPTLFGMTSGRLGLMGEAGPEAILPLQRLANGRLGVEAAGGGGASYIINVDARGATDPAEVEAAGYRGAQRALAEQMPGIVRASSSLAHARTVNDWHRRGGRFR